MSSRTVSIAFQTDHPLAAYGPLAAAAEGYGFDGVSVYNDLLYQPAWPALFEIARATRRVQIGPAAMNPFTCHPLSLAGHVALLDEASAGRAYLGLARGAWLGFLHLEPARPVTALREALECVRHLLRGDRQPYRGRVFSLAGGETLRWAVPRREIPFLLGAWGARTIRACAPHVAEVKVGGTASPSVVRTALGEVRAAAVQAGRPPDAVGLAVGYALQAAIPLLPAKQRPGHPADWMETDTHVTCPIRRAASSCGSSAPGGACSATTTSARCPGSRRAPPLRPAGDASPARLRGPGPRSRIDRRRQWIP